MQIVILILPGHHLFRKRKDKTNDPFQKEISSLKTRPLGQGSLSEEVQNEHAIAPKAPGRLIGGLFSP